MLGLDVVKEGRDSPVICLQLSQVLLQSRHRSFYLTELRADCPEQLNYLTTLRDDNVFIFYTLYEINQPSMFLPLQQLQLNIFRFVFFFPRYFSPDNRPSKSAFYQELPSERFKIEIRISYTCRHHIATASHTDPARPEFQKLFIQQFDTSRFWLPPAWRAGKLIHKSEI